jgi:ABC-type transporter Mla subunit MlaD
MTNLLDIYRKIGGIINPDDLDDLVRQLHAKRQELARAKDDIQSTEVSIAASDLGRALEAAKERAGVAKSDLDELDAKLRQVALDVYQRTQDAKPFGDRRVQIKQYTTVDYDPDTALDYARQHLRAAVKLDKRKFDRLSKDLELDFVTIEQEPRATIARDLSQFLEDD